MLSQLMDARIPCDLLLVAIGIAPNIDFIQASGIACGQGVKVDAAMRTNAPDIYAVGDVIETTDAITGHTRILGQWFPAIQQARTAAYSMLDQHDTTTTGHILQCDISVRFRFCFSRRHISTAGARLITLIPIRRLLPHQHHVVIVKCC